MARLRYLQNKRSGAAGTISKATEKVYFYDEGMYIGATADGTLALISDTTLNIEGTTALNLTGTTITLTGAITMNGDITLTGDDLLAITVTDPTTACNAIYGYIDAGGNWTSDNMVGLRGKVAISVTGATHSATGVWAGLDISAASTRNGLYCALNAEVSSTASTMPNAIVYIQSLPGSGANFSTVPYIVFSETPTGTGSNILFELGHSFANTTTTITSGTLFYQDTIQIAVNKVAGTRTAYYIPLSTAEGSYTTIYPIITGTTSVPMAVTSTISARKCYTDIQENVDTANVYANYYELEMSTGVDFTTAGQADAIYGIINVEGTGTTWTSTGGLIAIQGVLTSDGNQFDVTNGIHAALGARLRPMDNFDVSGSSHICGLFVDNQVHSSAVIAAGKLSGIYIATLGAYQNLDTAIFIAATCDTGIYLGGYATTGISIDTCTTGIAFTGACSTAAIAISSLIGIKSTATFVPDTNRTSYALAVGTINDELSLTMVSGDTKNFSPIQMNIDLGGSAPTTSTINLIHSLLRHDTVNMPNVRLKCADWTIISTKQVKDMYVIQTELDIDSTETIAGEAYAASFYTDVGSDNFTCDSRIGALLLTVSGDATVTADSSRFDVAHFNAVGASTVDNVLCLKVWNATATNILYVQNGGTAATGINITGAYSTAAINITSTVAATGDYGILVTDTYTRTTGNHDAITGVTVYTPTGDSGYGWINAVSGKVTLTGSDSFTGGQGGLFGGQFQLDFGASSIMNNASSIFAGVRGVITGNTPTLTAASVVACCYLDNLSTQDLSGTAQYGSSLLSMQNHGGVIDNAIEVFGGTITYFLAIHGAPTFLENSCATGVGKKLAVDIGGTAYWLNLIQAV